MLWYHATNTSWYGNFPRCKFAGMLQQVFIEEIRNQTYESVWNYQEKLLQRNTAIKSRNRGIPVVAENLATLPQGESETTHYFLLVEHSPVYTLGRNGNTANVLISEEALQKKGIEYFHINRGGDITFHGPGQIVGYPILDLEKFNTDLGWYLRSLEEVIILTMAEYGLKGSRSKGETGVWMDPDLPGQERKICAMGIRCSRWVTMHGFAFNVNTDLSYFDHIIPCGIRDKKVTSLNKELGYELDLAEVRKKLKRNFEQIFDVKLIENRLNAGEITLNSQQ